MATAIVFKSESAYYYLYAVDKDKVNSVEHLKELLKEEWYISTKEAPYVVRFTSDFDDDDVGQMLSDLLYGED